MKSHLVPRLLALASLSLASFLRVAQVCIIASRAELLEQFGCATAEGEVKGKEGSGRLGRVVSHCILIRLGSMWPQQRPSPCDLMGSSPLSSSVLGILQASILERVTLPFSRVPLLSFMTQEKKVSEGSSFLSHRLGHQ